MFSKPICSGPEQMGLASWMGVLLRGESGENGLVLYHTTPDGAICVRYQETC